MDRYIIFGWVFGLLNFFSGVFAEYNPTELRILNISVALLCWMLVLILLYGKAKKGN